MPESLDMNQSLASKYNAIRALLASAAANEVCARYDAGALIAEVKLARDKYGRRAVAQLGAALGERVPTLYRYATVAERWTREDVETLVARSASRGRALSWSHFVVLAGVPHPRRRAELCAQVLREMLSVRDLSALIQASRRPASSSPQGTTALVQLVRAADHWSNAIVAWQRGTTFSPQGSELQALVERAIATHDILREDLRSHLAGSGATSHPHMRAAPMLARTRPPARTLRVIAGG